MSKVRVELISGLDVKLVTSPQKQKKHKTILGVTSHKNLQSNVSVTSAWALFIKEQGKTQVKI